MKQARILAVDDEPLNLEIIREYLDDPRWTVDLAPNAERAWEKLEAATVPYDVLVLDRMMPGMNGIELLRRVKADPRFRFIPVIMQTAASAPEQIREGIEAGAYYYLTKPYDPEALLAIIRAAISDVEVHAETHRCIERQLAVLNLMEHAEFRFRTIEEATELAGLLASLCPQPEAVAMGLTELLVNAVEHGNLGISYEEKARLKREDAWEAEVARRLALPELRERRVFVAMRRDASGINFTICDQGEGFDWHRYLAFDPARAFDPNGRGIAMARAMSFDSLDFLGNGNTVRAHVASAAPNGASAANDRGALSAGEWRHTPVVHQLR